MLLGSMRIHLETIKKVETLSETLNLRVKISETPSSLNL